MDKSLDEQVFRKMGWEWIEPTVDTPVAEPYWAYDGKVQTLDYEGFPPISSVWEVTAKYLVPFMRERGWLYEIRMDGQGNIAFAWQDNIDAGATEYIYAEIKNDDLALAACESFMEVEL